MITNKIIYFFLLLKQFRTSNWRFTIASQRRVHSKYRPMIRIFSKGRKSKNYSQHQYNQIVCELERNKKSRDWTGAKVVILLDYGSVSMLKASEISAPCGIKSNVSQETGTTGGMHWCPLPQLPNKRLRQCLSTVTCASILCSCKTC